MPNDLYVFNCALNHKPSLIKPKVEYFTSFAHKIIITWLGDCSMDCNETEVIKHRGHFEHKIEWKIYDSIRNEYLSCMPNCKIYGFQK